MRYALKRKILSAFFVFVFLASVLAAAYLIFKG
jgi:hypothetical protein